MEIFEIWMGGHQATGTRSTAQCLGPYCGETFSEACELALKDHEFDLTYYNPENSSYWGCGMFDNESEAREECG